MKKIICLLLICITLLPTGCWSRKEIEERGIVTGMGIDVVNIEGREKFRVSVQMVRGKTSTGGGTSGIGGMAGEEKPFWVASSIGDDPYNAIVNLNTRSPRRIDLSHVGAIVLGQKLAESRLAEVLDFFQRSRELRFRTWMLVAKGEALDVINVQAEMENSLFKEIDGLINNRKEISKSFMSDLNQFMISFASPGSDPATGVIELIRPMEIKQGKEKPAVSSGRQEAEKSVRLHETAVFKVDRLVGILTDTESSGLLWVKGLVTR